MGRLKCLRCGQRGEHGWLASNPLQCPACHRDGVSATPVDPDRPFGHLTTYQLTAWEYVEDDIAWRVQERLAHELSAVCGLVAALVELRAWVARNRAYSDGWWAHWSSTVDLDPVQSY